RPKDTWKSSDGSEAVLAPSRHEASELRRAWAPWVLLSLVVFLWGTPQVKNFLNGKTALCGWRFSSRLTAAEIPVPHLHNVVLRAPPVASATAPPEKAIFTLNWLSATGSGILLAALLAGGLMGFAPLELAATYGRTLHLVRFS